MESLRSAAERAGRAARALGGLSGHLAPGAPRAARPATCASRPSTAGSSRRHAHRCSNARRCRTADVRDVVLALSTMEGGRRHTRARVVPGPRRRRARGRVRGTARLRACARRQPRVRRGPAPRARPSFSPEATCRAGRRPARSIRRGRSRAFSFAEALEPLVRDAGPERILALRIVDPAMGSGAFLVAACRFLARAYEAALVRDGQLPRGGCLAGGSRRLPPAGGAALPLRRRPEPDGRSPGAAVAVADDARGREAAHVPGSPPAHGRQPGRRLAVRRRAPAAGPQASRRGRDERQLPLFDPAAAHGGCGRAFVPCATRSSGRSTTRRRSCAGRSGRWPSLATTGALQGVEDSRGPLVRRAGLAARRCPRACSTRWWTTR